MKRLILLVFLFSGTSAEEIPLHEVVGLYASGSEIAGFTATKLFLEANEKGDLLFQKDFRSDVVVQGEIKQDPILGSALYTRGMLILAEPHGFTHGNRTMLFSRIEQYFPVRVKDSILLMRSDSYKSWAEKKTVYDYGILLRVGKTLGNGSLKDAVIPPFKLAELFGVGEWKDPFVNGPNKTDPQK